MTTAIIAQTANEPNIVQTADESTPSARATTTVVETVVKPTPKTTPPNESGGSADVKGSRIAIPSRATEKMAALTVITSADSSGVIRVVPLPPKAPEPTPAHAAASR